jgi:enoyl-CoA hydratase/carnithine racemase
MMDDETWMNAEDAVAMGFVDEIYKPKERKKPMKAEAKPVALCPAAISNKAAASAKRMKLKLSNLAK